MLLFKILNKQTPTIWRRIYIILSNCYFNVKKYTLAGNTRYYHISPAVIIIISFIVLLQGFIILFIPSSINNIYDYGFISKDLLKFYRTVVLLLSIYLFLFFSDFFIEKTFFSSIWYIKIYNLKNYCSEKIKKDNEDYATLFSKNKFNESLTKFQFKYLLLI